MAPKLVNGRLSSSLNNFNANIESRWIVQKFGGTSVGKHAEKIPEDVVLYCPDTFIGLMKDRISRKTRSLLYAPQ